MCHNSIPSIQLPIATNEVKLFVVFLQHMIPNSLERLEVHIALFTVQVEEITNWLIQGNSMFGTAFCTFFAKSGWWREGSVVMI